MDRILSVGIDIGTSTTQVIFSRLSVENTAGFFSVPHVDIVSKEILYKSVPQETPLKSPVLIDAGRVRELVDREFRKAGYRPEDTQSGAVIITGESARKENSDAVLAELSDFSGLPPPARIWNLSLPEKAAAHISTASTIIAGPSTWISAEVLQTRCCSTMERRYPEAVWTLAAV